MNHPKRLLNFAFQSLKGLLISFNRLSTELLLLLFYLCLLPCAQCTLETRRRSYLNLCHSNPDFLLRSLCLHLLSPLSHLGITDRVYKVNKKECSYLLVFKALIMSPRAAGPPPITSTSTSLDCTPSPTLLILFDRLLTVLFA